MLKAILLASLFVSAQAFAYAEKTYVCKNSNANLPDNTYKIENVTVGGASVPYVEIVRNFSAGEEGGAATQSTIRGIATVATNSATGRQLLLIAALQLEFDGDTLVNCRQ